MACQLYLRDQLDVCVRVASWRVQAWDLYTTRVHMQMGSHALICEYLTPQGKNDMEACRLMAPAQAPPLERFLPTTCPACAREVLARLLRFDPSKRMPCAKVWRSQCVWSCLACVVGFTDGSEWVEMRWCTGLWTVQWHAV